MFHRLHSAFLLFCIFNSPFFIAKAQINLVANPSFETYTTCPTNSSQIYYAVGWNNFGDSPDYFNLCSLSPDFSVPYNWGGFQVPANGNAYSAFGTYLTRSTGIYNNREFVGGELFPLLTPGTKYFVSFKVSLSLSTQIQVNCASNHIGAKFSTVAYSWTTPTPITNSSTVYVNNKIIDSLNWTQVFGSFVADSSYKYIIIGNFFDDFNTDTLIMDGGTMCSSYYYLDEVCVSTDSLFTLQYTTSIPEESDFPGLVILPNPCSTYFTVSNSRRKELRIKIYDLFGNVIMQIKNCSQELLKIDLRDLPSQMLHIQILSENKIYNYKLIKT